MLSVPATFTWDDEVNAGYLDLTPDMEKTSRYQKTVTNPVPGQGELVLDFDEDGRLLGIEVLAPDPHLTQQEKN